MSWQLASLVVLGLALAAGFGWYEREQPPARVLALVATLAALAVVGRLAFAAIPNVKPTTDIVLFAGYALGAVPGFTVGAVTALVSNIFLSQGPWTPWQMVGWGAVGVGGRRCWRACCAGREPGRLLLAAGLRPGRPRLRRLDGPLPADARRPPGPRLLPRAGGHVAALQPRSRDRERGVLPLDRTGLHPRAAPLPPPPGGALAARPRAPPRRCVLALLLVLPAAAGAASPASAPSAGCCGARTRTAASAPRPARPRAASTAAGPGSGWRRPATTRATCTAAAGARWPPTSRAARAPSRTSARSSAPCCCSAPRACPARLRRQGPGRRDPRRAAAPTARSPAT